MNENNMQTTDNLNEKVQENNQMTNNNQKKNNKELKIAIIIILIVGSIVGSFFLGNYLSDKKSKNNNNKDNTQTTENNKTNVNDNTNVTVNNNTVVTENKTDTQTNQDIYEQIKQIKSENIDEIEKIEKVHNAVYEYIYGKENIIEKAKCKVLNETETSLGFPDTDYYYCTSVYYFSKDDTNAKTNEYYDKNITYMAGYQHTISLDKNVKEIKGTELTTLEERKAYAMHLTYYGMLDKEYDDIYGYLAKKYNVDSQFVCPGYSYNSGDEYFYMNFSTAKRGYYSLNRKTGECSDITKELVTYKFNIKTNKYEIIEK